MLIFILASEQVSTIRQRQHRHLETTKKARACHEVMHDYGKASVTFEEKKEEGDVSSVSC